MTTFHKKLPFSDVFPRDRQKAARAGTEWESVMVQITLAFVIILGYLISKGITESQSLAAESAMQRKQNALLEKIVADFSNTEAGRERTRRIEAQRQLQMQRLLNRWLKIRGERLFYRLLQQYRAAELIPLSPDLRSLPSESSFDDLNREIDRIFPFGKEKVSSDELQRLMDDVLTAEGFDLQAVTELFALGKISPQAAALHDDAQTPTWENLNMLKLQIAGDLNSERSELVRIQYALVEKIAAARLKRLAALPLEAEADTTLEVNTPDLGRVMLERILKELRAEMRLLPETADILRAANDTTPTTDPN
jgi:hypothetical protein